MNDAQYSYWSNFKEKISIIVMVFHSKILIFLSTLCQNFIYGLLKIDLCISQLPN